VGKEGGFYSWGMEVEEYDKLAVAPCGEQCDELAAPQHGIARRRNISLTAACKLAVPMVRCRANGSIP
jgi:hypothetical protein